MVGQATSSGSAWDDLHFNAAGAERPEWVDRMLATTEQIGALTEQIGASTEQIKKLCLERLSMTRCASKISRDDLREVRHAFRIILQVKDADQDEFVRHEEFW